MYIMELHVKCLTIKAILVIISWHDCKMPFHNNGKGLYPCGMPRESEGRRYCGIIYRSICKHVAHWNYFLN